MVYSNGADYDTIPEWILGAQGPKNVKPTRYFTAAQKRVQEHGGNGRIGYWVRNQYGKILPMTFLQAERMEDLFDRGLLEKVDWYETHYAPQEAGLTGYDTEGTDAIYKMGYNM